MSDLVSILIPVYNRAGMIAETLDSALAQSYKNIEVIVVDNSSTDGTWEIVQAYAVDDSRVRCFRNSTNIGPVRNWLRCVEESAGYYGKILWSDDLISQDFLEKTIPYLNDKEVGFVFTAVKIFKSLPAAGEIFYRIGETGIYPTEKFIVGDIQARGYPVSPGCAVFRIADLKKNLLLHVPNSVGSDFSMHAIGNDLLLFLLTAQEYSKFAFVSEVLSFFRVHEGSISTSSIDCKLPLHYNLARSFFVERYRLDLLYLLNEKLYLELWRYPDSAKFGVRCVSDFYPTNKDARFSKAGLISFFVRKLFEKSFLMRAYKYLF